MLHKVLQLCLPEIISLLDIIGVIIITVGALKTFYYYVISYVKRERYNIVHKLGYSLALGLEFKMGSEILKTVLIEDLHEIWMLGAIIILRGLLSALIHFEMRSVKTEEQ